MPKYITVEVHGIITQIAKETEIKAYTEGVLEAFLPDDDVLENWTDEESEAWTKENNIRMKGICQFLNNTNL